MIPYQDHKLLIFIHIPKTAGSTLQQLIFHNYRDAERFVLGKASESDKREGKPFREIYSEQLQRIKAGGDDGLAAVRVLFGHMDFGLHRYLKRDAQYATMIRHPVSRVVSHYRFVRRSPAHYLHDRVVSEDISLEEYIGMTKAKELDNGQVRNLFGESQRNIAFGSCAREHLNTALENIDRHFFFVGVQERFVDSVKELARITGWRVPELQARNVSDAEPEEVPPGVAEEILAHNRLDMELYERLNRDGSAM